eukprot:COSAG04_NODE_12248_length_662_cov_2.330373_1_plen_178_part_00
MSSNLFYIANGYEITGFPVLLRIDGSPFAPQLGPEWAQGIVCQRAGVPRACSAAAGDPRDMAASWRAIFARAKPFLLKGTVSGVFIGDELTSRGMPLGDFETIVDAVAADLRTLEGRTPQPLIVWANEDGHIAGWGPQRLPNPHTPPASRFDPWPRRFRRRIARIPRRRRGRRCTSG